MKAKAEPGEPTAELVTAAVAVANQRFDATHGGFGYAPYFAPKFPHATELALLLRHHARTGDASSLAMVTTTLHRMAVGGLYDQLGGGFHRYSVDREWVVPHFEKMLYDNAQLARLYTEAFAATGEAEYARIARETLDYLIREMTDPEGGIWSTTDADSEGEEGKFFVWTKAQFDDLLGDDAALVARHFGVDARGNFEGHTVLQRVVEPAALATEFSVPLEDVERRLAAARAKLLTTRATRVAPGTDDKVLAAWNGLAIGAFAYAHQVFDEPRYLGAAQRAAEFLWSSMQRDGRLHRTWRKGTLGGAGYLEDQTFVAEGFLTLFESDADPRWLTRAKTLLDATQAHFATGDGGFWFTADDHEELVARSRSITESSWPSGTALAATAFQKLGLLTGDTKTYDVGVQALRANDALLRKLAGACNGMLLAVDLHLAEPREIVVVGAPDDPATQALLSAARRAFPPDRVVVHVHDGNREALERATPIVAGKTTVDGKSAAYVCRLGVCDAPVTDPKKLR